MLKDTQNFERNLVSEARIELAISILRNMLITRLMEKGRGEYSSPHEAFGIISEEYFELAEAIRSNDKRKLFHECQDIAVACLFTMACLLEEPKER